MIVEYVSNLKCSVEIGVAIAHDECNSKSM